AAHDLPRGFEASLAAARDAESMHGHADAQEHYDRAIDLWDAVPDAAVRAGVDRTGLLERAASNASVSDPARALPLIGFAIESADADASRVRMALLKERLGRYEWLAGDGVSALESCREAARLVADEPATRERARVLASLGQILMIAADME